MVVDNLNLAADVLMSDHSIISTKGITLRHFLDLSALAETSMMLYETCKHDQPSYCPLFIFVGIKAAPITLVSDVEPASLTGRQIT